LVALGVAAELTLSTLAKGALNLPPLRRSGKSRALTTRDGNGGSPDGLLAVSETVIMRRLIFRR
jgi:hypothetical protein